MHQRIVLCDDRVHSNDASSSRRYLREIRNITTAILLDVNANRSYSYLEPLQRAVSRFTSEKKTRYPLNILDGTVYSEEGNAELFAYCTEEQFTVHRGVSDPAHEVAV